MNAPETRNLTSEPGNGILPTGEFFTPEYYELEKERIFKKSWLRVGREEQIPNIGDYFVQELEVCDTSLIIVRGRDKRIRAFHNNCSHRNNRMAYEATGNAGSAFRCRFHSWSYGLDGKLMAVPEEHHFPGLDKSQHGLTEVACESWEDFIYINVDPSPAQTLREYLGEELYNGFGGYFKTLKQVHKMSAIVNCNWKASLDAFVETYHFSTVHALTAKDIVTSREFPNGRVDAFREFGKHRIVSVGSNMEHSHAFTESLARKFNGGATLAGNETKQFPNAPQLNPKNLPDWLTDIAVIFPMANTQPLGRGFFVCQNYWPLSHDKTRWELVVFMAPPQTAAEEVAIEYNRVLLIDLNREDLNNLEWVQKNLKAQSKRYQVLGEMEVMVRSAYKTVSEQIGHGW